MNYITRILFLCLTAAILLPSCADDPGITGSGMIPQEDIVDILFLDTKDHPFEQRSYFYDVDSVDFGASPTIFLGKYQNLESSILLRFFIFLPDTLYLALESDSLIVTKSWIETKPIYSLGNSNDPFDFTVHKINSSWLPPDFDRDSLANLQYDADDASADHEITDTTITFNLSNQLVQDWLTAKLPDSELKNYGLYFKHTPGTEKILGFTGLSMDQEEQLKLYVVVEKPGEYTDTLTTEPELDVHVPGGSFTPGSAENIYFQGGIITRGNLWFDVSDIPEKSLINRAELFFYIDTLETIEGSVISDSIEVAMWADSASRTVATSFSRVNLTRNADVISGDISHFIQSWVNGGPNEGLRLRLTQEIKTMNRIAIKGSNSADTTLRPRLQIYYATKRESN